MKRKALWMGALCWLLASSAWADAVSVTLQPRGMIGKGYPSVNLRIVEPIAGFSLKLKRSDGKEQEWRGGGKPGQTREIELMQPEGKHHYSGELKVNFPNATTASTPLEFDAEFLGPLRLAFQKKDVDMVGRSLTFTLSRPAKKAQVAVRLDDGRLAYDGEVVFHGEPAGTPLTVTWPAVSGKLLSVGVRAWDTFDFYTGVEVSPWKLEIPHDEISFEPGKAEIPAADERKLDASMGQLQEALKKYGKLATLKLYVAGHTDRVGKADANRELSFERARNIALGFRKRGLRIPIFCEGFGEAVPVVPTNDEAAEPRNTRVEYLLAIEEPVMKGAAVEAEWQKL